MTQEIPEFRISFKQLQAEARAGTGPPADAGGIRATPQLRVPVAFLLHRIGLAASREEARSLRESGAVELDGAAVTRDVVVIRDGQVVTVGKRRFMKIVDADSSA